MDLWDLSDRYYILFDARVARIESMENSLLKQVENKADTESNIVLAHQARAETGMIIREFGHNKITFDEIYAELTQWLNQRRTELANQAETDSE